MPENKSIEPMEHHNIGDFLKGQSSKILTAISDDDKTAFVLKNGNIGTYSPSKTVEYEDTVRLQARKVMPEQIYDCPLRVHIQFYMIRPASKPKKALWPTTKPDIDNLAKAITDAMNGLIYTDDSRICEMVLTKYYEPDSRKVGVRVQVMELE